MEKRKGFTLVELIVVLVILSILAAISVPSFVKYIDKARKAGVLLECRLCVTAAQTLQIENYGMGTGDPTVEEIATLADVPGKIDPDNMKMDDGVLYHLSYTRDSYTCTYCREYEKCTDTNNHNERYNFSDAEDSPGGGGTPGGGDEKPEKPTIPGPVDIGSDGTKMYVLYDLDKFEAYNKTREMRNGTVFYWNGDYYYIQYTVSYCKGESKDTFISRLLRTSIEDQGEGKGIVKIVNPQKFVGEGEKPLFGSLKKGTDEDGKSCGMIYTATSDYPEGHWNWSTIANKREKWMDAYDGISKP